MTTQYHSALVVGLGESGESAAGLLAGEGTQVTAIDSGNTPALAARAELLAGIGVRAFLGVTSPAESFFEEHGGFDVCVVSPGVKPESEILRAVERAGVEMISELELGADRCRCRILGITGSNGKSTASKLCRDALLEAGLRTAVAGNFGRALSRVGPESGDLDWVVVEVSSFQLEKAKTFQPRVGVLLNIHPNHLDWHGSMEAYRELKMRMFGRMRKGDVAVVPWEVAGDADARRALAGGEIVTTFGLSESADFRFGGNRVWLKPGRRLEPVSKENGQETDHGGGTAKSVGFENTMFANEILGVTAAACVAAVEACGEDPSAVARAARNFQPLAHRLETVAEIRGITFVDDSKATNLSALRAALWMLPGRVRLIAGGLLKESALGLVREALAEKVSSAYLIGRDGPMLKDAWADTVTCQVCETLENAVRQAWADAIPGDTVLLSPGCTSFDQFANFEERGSRFLEIVATLS